MPHGITLHIIQLQLPGVRNGATCVSFGSLWQLWTQSIKPSYRFQAKVALEIENARWNPVVFFNTKFHHFLVGFFWGVLLGRHTSIQYVSPSHGYCFQGRLCLRILKNWLVVGGILVIGIAISNVGSKWTAQIFGVFWVHELLKAEITRFHQAVGSATEVC